MGGDGGTLFYLILLFGLLALLGVGLLALLGVL